MAVRLSSTIFYYKIAVSPVTRFHFTRVVIIVADKRWVCWSSAIATSWPLHDNNLECITAVDILNLLSATELVAMAV